MVVVISCKKKDSCDNFTLDLIQQTLVVQIIDSDGNNLIENGTYDATEVFTERNGDIRKPVVFNETELPDLPEELKNVIIVDLFDSKPEGKIIKIHLNDDEIDILSMDLKVLSEGCSGAFYEILEIIYNQETVLYEDIGNNYYIITIVK